MQINMQQEWCGDWNDFSGRRELVYLRSSCCLLQKERWTRMRKASKRVAPKPFLSVTCQRSSARMKRRTFSNISGLSQSESSPTGVVWWAMTPPNHICWSAFSFHVSLLFLTAETRCICNIWKREIGGKGKIFTCRTGCLYFCFFSEAALNQFKSLRVCQALSRLHQLELLGHTLVVQFAKGQDKFTVLKNPPVLPRYKKSLPLCIHCISWIKWTQIRWMDCCHLQALSQCFFCPQF